VKTEQLLRCGHENTAFRREEEAAFVAAPYSQPMNLCRIGHGHRVVEAKLGSKKESAMEDQDRLADATKAVDAKIGFYVHLVVYAVVNAGLIAINLLTSTEHLWFKWPLLGWGVGVFFHALAVFVFPKGRSIREQMIARETTKKTLEKP
jgi:hypothetical protein